MQNARRHRFLTRSVANQVAKWAGHSVAVLMSFYAKCRDDREDAAKRRIEALFNEGTESVQ